MARLNITISDDLYSRLESQRTRLNFSRVCAVALENAVTEQEQEIARLENLRKDVEGMEQVIERLKEEKEGLLKQRFEEGVEDAKRWVQFADYGEICSWVETAKQCLPEIWSFDSPPLPDKIKEEWDDLRKDEDDRQHVPIGNDQIVSFAEGFYNGLLEIWEIIESKT